VLRCVTNNTECVQELEPI